MNLRNLRALAAVAAVLGTCVMTAQAAELPADAALKKAVADPARGPAHTARDIYRHPYESLAFWGVKPGLTVIEIAPGAGYWTEILAPYAKATGGRYIATVGDTSNPKMSEASRKFFTDFKARFAPYDAQWVVSGEGGGPLGAPNSADIVITARNIHDFMWEPGLLDKTLAEFRAVLKPGGILAIEDHRADPRAQVTNAHDGYVSTAVMVAAVEKAGFKLDASSEINANPKDTKDYPFGVWSLPPTNATQVLGFMKPWPGRGEGAPLDPAKAKAIGESDRMTLRFRKQ